MKKTVFVLFLCGLLSTSDAQKPDSLDNVIKTARADTSRVMAYALLSEITRNPDSSVALAEKGLALAKKIKFRKGEAEMLKQLANAYVKTSNYGRALEYFLGAQRLYEDMDDQDGIQNMLRQIGRIYSRQGDRENALSYFRRAGAILRQMNRDERVVYFPIGTLYDRMDKNDSALFYYQRAYEYISTSGDRKGMAGVLSHLGGLHVKMNNLPLALSFGRMAVAAFEQYNPNDEGSAYNHLAEMFIKAGMKDSAIYYAEKNYAKGERLGDKDMKLEAAALLARLYEDDHTALKYHRIAAALRDSVYDDEITVQIRNLSFNERKRQEELTLAKEAEKDQRRKNIQYGAIAIGLISLVIAFLLLSHSVIVNERLIRFFGIMALLLVFEFINLVAHPYIGDFTHHEPVWMLLVLAGIAALLIPLHHKLEKMVKQKLVEKNKRIRLQAAKKTIAKLEGETTIIPREEKSVH
jgi:tetratricopeptide (TPR) repeat protein